MPLASPLPPILLETLNFFFKRYAILLFPTAAKCCSWLDDATLRRGTGGVECLKCCVFAPRRGSVVLSKFECPKRFSVLIIHQLAILLSSQGLFCALGVQAPFVPDMVSLILELIYLLPPGTADSVNANIGKASRNDTIILQPQASKCQP